MATADFARGTLRSVSENTNFSEWFLPGFAWWLSAPGFGAAIALALLPLSVTVAIIGAITATLLVICLLLVWSPRIRVESRTLHAGPAHIDCALLGSGEALSGETLREALGPGLDARTWMCVRPWVKRAIFIENLDPQDPAPAWIIATRRPDQLLAAINSGPGNTQSTN